MLTCCLSPSAVICPSSLPTPRTSATHRRMAAIPAAAVAPRASSPTVTTASPTTVSPGTMTAMCH